MDYVLPATHIGFEEKHFCIFWDQEDNNFKLVDLFNGSGTFILLTSPVQLKSSGQLATLG